jgi:hypothetical protein
MPRRRTDLALRARRGWVWRADAEWRWRRALRLLLSVRGAQAREVASDDGGGVRTSFNRSASREADDRTTVTEHSKAATGEHVKSGH